MKKEIIYYKNTPLDNCIIEDVDGIYYICESMNPDFGIHSDAYYEYIKEYGTRLSDYIDYVVTPTEPTEEFNFDELVIMLSVFDQLELEANKEGRFEFYQNRKDLREKIKSKLQTK